jgi:hypothetical protein
VGREVDNPGDMTVISTIITHPMKVQFKDWRLKDLPDAPLIPPEKTPIPPNAPKVPVQGAPQRKP